MYKIYKNHVKNICMHIYYDIICLKLLKLKISNMFQKNDDAINKVYYRERFMDLKKKIK